MIKGHQPCGTFQGFHFRFQTTGYPVLTYLAFNIIYQVRLPPIVARASSTSSASESCNEAVNLVAEEETNHQTNAGSCSHPVPGYF